MDVVRIEGADPLSITTRTVWPIDPRLADHLIALRQSRSLICNVHTARDCQACEDVDGPEAIQIIMKLTAETPLAKYLEQEYKSSYLYHGE